MNKVYIMSFLLVGVFAVALASCTTVEIADLPPPGTAENISSSGVYNDEPAKTRSSSSAGTALTPFSSSSISIQQQSSSSMVQSNSSIALSSSNQQQSNSSSSSSYSSINSNNYIVCGTTVASYNEGDYATVSCSSGIITDITFASYGTPTGSCGNFAISGCHANSSLSVVSLTCLGKTSCKVLSHNDIFDDPCLGTVKHLYIQAVCSSTEGFSSSSSTHTTDMVDCFWAAENCWPKLANECTGGMPLPTGSCSGGRLK